MHPQRSRPRRLQPLPFARTVIAFGLPSALSQFRQVAVPLDIVPPYLRRLQALRAWRARHFGHAVPVRRRRSFALNLSRIRIRMRKGDHWFVVGACALAIAAGVILAYRDFQAISAEPSRFQMETTRK